MARNRQHDTRRGADENTTGAGEMGANIYALSRSAEQSVNGFSRMVGFGQSPREAFQESARGLELAQNWARTFGGAYQDISLEYVNWLQKQAQTNMTSLLRLMQCRTAEQLAAAYNQLLGENIALALMLNGRVAEISKEVVDRTAERMAEVVEQTRETKQQAA
jgi:hypothetical protein